MRPRLGLEGLTAGIDARLRARARRKMRTVLPWVAPGQRLLDIGAGEGYVGLEAGRAGLRVHLADSVVRNRTHLPFTACDAHALAWRARAFDVALLSYVLHHCADPDRVLAEAARVSCRVVVLESVIETAFDRWLLTRLDHLANRLWGMPPEPLRFDTPAGWEARFQAVGLRMIEARWLGRVVHKHRLYVLEPAPLAWLSLKVATALPIGRDLPTILPNLRSTVTRRPDRESGRSRAASCRGRAASWRRRPCGACSGR